MRDDFLGAVIGQRQQRTARAHQRARPLRHGDEAVDRDVHGHQEIVHRRVDELSAQLILVRIADSVDDEVELAPLFLERTEGLVERLHVRDVAIDQQVGTEFGGERANALLERFALIGEGQLRTLLTKRAGDTPGQRTLVSQAHDQPAFALHQSCQSCGPSLCSTGWTSSPGCGSSTSSWSVYGPV